MENVQWMNAFEWIYIDLNIKKKGEFRWWAYQTDL